MGGKFLPGSGSPFFTQYRPGIIAQLCLTLLPMYIVLERKLPLLLDSVLLPMIIFILKRTWWDKLDDF